MLFGLLIRVAMPVQHRVVMHVPHRVVMHVHHECFTVFGNEVSPKMAPDL